MANNKMLIDCSHPEETRVVVVKGNKVDEFDFESASRKQLRGNIYLAKVTRVEPSLQAAFVDYGGNRHGFLAFSEIHPDYYQIPVADRQALLAAEAAAMEDEDDADDDDGSPDDGDTADVASADGAVDPVAAPAPEEADPVSASETTETEVEQDGSEETDATAAEDKSAGTDTDEPPAGPAMAARSNSDDQVSAEVGSVEPEGTTGEAEKETVSDTGESRADEDGADAPKPKRRRSRRTKKSKPEDPATAAEAAGDATDSADAEPTGEETEESADSDESDTPKPKRRRRGQRGRRGSRARQNSDRDSGDEDDSEDQSVEDVGAEDVLEEVSERRKPRPRQYKIQEVIKRRQVLLVQVVKEERGNKGAALTTYLSLAGRYSVLMPNTARGGGISRKITNVADRKRLKGIATKLDVPTGMGVILRTAGASRTENEITRDFDYLSRLWETIRDHTLKSSAPTLVYEEGSLIKRSIRDLYNKDIGEIQVAGEAGYNEARSFMEMLMPEHVDHVKAYTDKTPLFTRTGVENQLDALFSPEVTLRSGGYIVINQTEALVSIDVNSGRSTREHSIEDTALQTNLEAAEEVARQLRLRDLAGLVVIDFIDMEEKKNNRAVERKMKDCLKVDRARIQLGRISHFGLLEMSRQRLRTGVLEGSTIPCPQCHGTGSIRSTDSVALHVLRALEDYLQKGKGHNMTVRTRANVALYMLNQKRANLADIERRMGIEVTVAVDESLGQELFALDRGELSDARTDGGQSSVQPDSVDFVRNGDDTEEEKPGRRKRKRRRKSKSERSAEAETDQPNEDGSGDAGGATEAAATETDDPADAATERPKRTRGKRGGRRNKAAEPNTEAEDGASASDVVASAEPESADTAAVAEPIVDDAPPLHMAEAEAEEPGPPEPDDAAPEVAPEAPEEPALSTEPVVVSTSTNGDKEGPKRTGWWRRG